jgi:hypothetical protein
VIRFIGLVLVLIRHSRRQIAVLKAGRERHWRSKVTRPLPSSQASRPKRPYLPFGCCRSGGPSSAVFGPLEFFLDAESGGIQHSLK